MSTRPKLDDFAEAGNDLENALTQIFGLAKVLMQLDLEDEATGYLGGQLKDHYDAARDAFRRIYGLGEDNRQRAGDDPVMALALERRRLQAAVQPIGEKVGNMVSNTPGYAELDAAEQALNDKIEAIELQMAKIVATSPAGIIEQVDTLREQIRSSDEPEREPMLDTIIAGVRAIAVKDGEAQP
jgi:hypothetical protein